MKKQGCLQNLTVVPVEEQPGEYYALIGNRRHGASKLPGNAGEDLRNDFIGGPTLRWCICFGWNRINLHKESQET